MKNLKLLLFSSIVLVIFACSSKETNLIGNDTPATILISSNSNTTQLKIIGVPEMNIVNDNILSGTEYADLKLKISYILTYNNQLYIVVPELFKIIVIDKFTFKKAAEYDFTSLGIKPIKLVFGDGTNAYVIFSNSSKAYVLDSYYHTIKAGGFEIGKGATDIVSQYPNGTGIYISLSEEDSIAYIKSNNYLLTSKFKTEARPTYLGITKNNDLIIVCNGTGKSGLAGDSVKSNANIQFYSMTTNSITNSIPIETKTIKAINQIPQSLCYFTSNYNFLATNEAFFRIDIVNKKVSSLGLNVYDQLVYNNLNQNIVAIKNTLTNSTLKTLDKSGSTEINTKVLPFAIETVNSYY